MEMSVKEGRLLVDGNIVINEKGELAVYKAAVEPVWYLPGVAERFGIEESVLRRALFEDTGGSFPELITREDLKVFLPPIGGLSVYLRRPDFCVRPKQALDITGARRMQWERCVWFGYLYMPSLSYIWYRGMCERGTEWWSWSHRVF